MMTKITLVLLSVVILSTAVGCGSPKASTPKDVILNMQKAVKNSNKKHFLACFNADGKNLRVLAATFEGLVAARDLEQEVTAVYGDDFAAELKGRTQFGDLLEATSDDITIAYDGEDEATARIPGVLPVELVRKDGVWLSDMGNSRKSEEEVDQDVEDMNAATKVMREYAGMARHHLSKEEFRRQFFRAVAAALQD